MRRAQTPLEHLLHHVRAEPSRTWSIIMSLYGDAIVPRGGSVWLGTVQQFCAHLGIADGVVRTAMSRLATDGWLTRRRVGRRSFYALSERGHLTFRDASAHIYVQQPVRWHGAYDLVIVSAPADRDALRGTMTNAGFGLLAPDMWLAPAGQALPAALSPHLRLSLSGDDASQRALAKRVWPIAAMAAAYARFLRAFRPLHIAITAGGALSGLDALAARVLLVHEYRRIVLRDPILPVEILPQDWPGAAARALCGEIYPRVLASSERWLDAHALDERGQPLGRARGLDSRFTS
ncbi:MAG TPA: phenylacetic acid degradation operon negative regulatory protein PaaX [Vicinamibacterales bacterium]|nr:phenylacetic acid degradation operon negative regulatory protein PaaX [Vicinamibacterales bacterium]